MERYWNPARRPELSFAAQAGSPGAIAHHCHLLRIGYDGSQPWWHIRAAGRVASVLHDFLSRAAIADGELIIIGHSMGGLVARYIVNNGEPDAPYHNEYVERDPRMDYGLVRRKTRAVITVAAPHVGSEAADALYGGADHAFANVSAAVLLGLGAMRESAANASLTRTYLEAAGRPGGEMADDGRTIPILTVAGTGDWESDDRAASANATRADRRLGWAWSLLCHRRGAVNLWGLLCGQSGREPQERAGDGVVELASAHGRWTRSVGQGGGTIAGPLRSWRDVRENHSQSRTTAQSYELIRALVASAPTPEEMR